MEQEKGEEEDDNWVLDTSKEAVEARRRELLGANERLSAAGDGAGDDEDGEEKAGEKQVSSAGKEKKGEIQRGGRRRQRGRQSCSCRRRNRNCSSIKAWSKSSQTSTGIFRHKTR